MHPVNWKLISGGAQDSYLFLAEKNYSAAMLAEDLLEAGIRIETVKYEEDADVGMKYYGGDLTVEAFLAQYDSLRKCGMGGMDYSFYCCLDRLHFTVGIADNEYGRSHNRVLFSGIHSDRVMSGIVRRLGKGNGEFLI